MEDQILERIAAEVAACTDVSNLHGITGANLRSHLVVPPRRGRFTWELADARDEDWMWVVVDERPDSGDGYLVVYDGNRDEFCLALKGTASNEGFVVGWYRSLLDTLVAM
jgi:hypothetical protein